MAQSTPISYHTEGLVKTEMIINVGFSGGPAEAPLGISLWGVRILGITHRGVKMPNIQLKSSVFGYFMLFCKTLGGSIDLPDPL